MCPTQGYNNIDFNISKSPNKDNKVICAVIVNFWDYHNISKSDSQQRRHSFGRKKKALNKTKRYL